MHWRRALFFLILSLDILIISTPVTIVKNSIPETDSDPPKNIQAPVIHPHPILLLPGFASSQLFNWRSYECDNGMLDVKVGERVWVDLAKVVMSQSCLLDCMKLDIETQDDLPHGCKGRAAEGVAAISELSPGFITGTLSTIWSELITKLADTFGYEPDVSLLAAPYDFRLPPRKLQDRDNFFYKLMLRIEGAVRHHSTQHPQIASPHTGVLVVAHSMGNNVFRYFLEWLKHEKGMFNYQKWLDAHIYAYVGVGTPHLGAIEPILGVVQGVNFGLPVPVGAMRQMGSTFGASGWLLPFSPKNNIGFWNEDVPLLTLELSENSLWLPSDDRGKTLVFTSKNISQFLNHTKHLNDPILTNTNYMLNKFYINDPVLNPLTEWDRPAIRRIYCIYGVNLPTEIGYVFKTSQNHGDWILKDTIWEHKNRIYSELTGQDILINNKSLNIPEHQKSGDGTVPYASLSWCHKWLGNDSANINITKIPQNFFQGEDTSPTFDDAEKSITFFESLTINKITGSPELTAIWEMDEVEHRDVIKNQNFIRELFEESQFTQEQLSNIINADVGDFHSSGFLFAPKHFRIPRRNEDCYWDYYNAACAWPKYCEYRYRFGDLILDHSCRLRREKGENNKEEKEEMCICGSECVKGMCRYIAKCKNSVQLHDGTEWGPCQTENEKEIVEEKGTFVSVDEEVLENQKVNH